MFRSVPFGCVCSGVMAFALAAPTWATVYPEIEPNDSKSNATPAFNMAHGDMLFGQSTSGAGAGLDYFRIRLQALAPGIYQYTLMVVAGGSTQVHTPTIRGLSQTAGIINPTSDITIQTGINSSSQTRIIRWYGFGGAHELYVRFSGTSTTTNPYTATLQVAPVIPLFVGSMPTGAITLTTVDQGHTTDTDLWVLDATYQAIPDAGNDDTPSPSSLQSTLTRSYATGEHVMALSDFNLATSLASPPDDAFRGGSVMDFAGVVVNSSSVFNVPLNFLVNSGFGSVPFGATKVVPFEVVFATFTVEACTDMCNPSCAGYDPCNPTCPGYTPCNPSCPGYDPCHPLCGVCSGACCIGGDCNISSPSQCSGNGGVYQGNGSSCEPSPCGIPCTCTGSCCTSSLSSGGGSCGQIVTLQAAIQSSAPCPTTFSYNIVPTGGGPHINIISGGSGSMHLSPGQNGSVPVMVQIAADSPPGTALLQMNTTTSQGDGCAVTASITVTPPATSATLSDSIACPLHSTSLTGSLTNNSNCTVNYQWSVAQSGGNVQLDFTSPLSGTMSLNPGESGAVVVTADVPRLAAMPGNAVVVLTGRVGTDTVASDTGEVIVPTTCGQETPTKSPPNGGPSGCKNCDIVASGSYVLDPVYLFSGEFYETAVDMTIKGRGVDFTWARKYRARFGPNTAQGNGWDFSYDIRVEASGLNRVVYDGNSRADYYTPAGAGMWTSAAQFRELILQGDGSYVLVFPDTGKWRLRAIDGSPISGKLSVVEDRNGNVVNFDYDGVGRLIAIRDSLHSGGNSRIIAIAYNSDGFISSVTDFTGRQVQYAYYQNGDAGGSFGDLRSVTSPAITGTPNGNDFPLGKTVTYTYSRGFADARLNHNLLTITDGKGQTYLTNVYASTTNPADMDFDRLVRQVWGNAGDIADIVYLPLVAMPANNFATIRVIVNDRVGNVREFFYDADNRGVMERDYTGRANPDMPTTDTTNRPTGKLRADDPDYFETRHEYNADHLLVRTIDPNDNEDVRTYDTANPNPRARGNMLSRCIVPGPLGGDQAQICESFEYDSGMGGGCCGSNFITRHVDGRGNVTEHTYDARGNRTHTQHRLAGIEENWEYNASGQVTAHVLPANGSGHRRRDEVRYYSSGPLTGYVMQDIVDATALALTTSYEYDALGRLIRVVDSRGFDTLYTLNALGQSVRQQSSELSPGVRYETLTWFDANNNIIRRDVQNRDENGAIQANTHFSSVTEYEILNYPTRVCRESGDAALLPTDLTCGALPASQFVTTEYEYDENRNRTLTRFGEAAEGRQPGNATRTLYDERDLLFRQIRAPGDAAQCTTQQDYDGNRNLRVTRTGLETTPHIMLYAHDGYNRRTSVVDAMGNVSTAHYDANGNVTSERTDGELVDVAGGAGNVRLSESSYVYDAMNRNTRVDTAFFDTVTQAPIGDGLSTRLRTFAPNSQVTQTTDDNGHTTLRTYDTANRLSAITDAKGNNGTRAYDAGSNVISITRVDQSDLGNPSQSFTTTYAYDALDRNIVRTDNLGNSITHGYDSRGNSVLEVDANGHESRYEYDGLNRLVSTVRDMNGNGANSGDASDIVTSQTWDDSSRRTTRTDDAGSVTRYAYDARDRMIVTQMADGTLQQVGVGAVWPLGNPSPNLAGFSSGYDVFGNRVTAADANGSVVNAAHDALNRTTLRTIARGADVGGTTYEVYQYDGLGRRGRLEDDDSLILRSYDSLDNETQETAQTLPGGPPAVTTSTFDGMSNRLTCTYPSGRVITVTYDELQHKDTISDAGGTIATYHYIGGMHVERRDLGNGVQQAYTYDGVTGMPNEPGDFGVGLVSHTRATHAADGDVIDDRAFAWDRDGNKVEREDRRIVGPRLTHAYEYDATHRMTGAQVIDSLSQIQRDTAYEYDGAGNRTVVTGGPDAGIFSCSSPLPEPGDCQMHQYSRTPSDSRAYDRNGNLIGRGCLEGDANDDGQLSVLDVPVFVSTLLGLADAECIDLNYDGAEDGDDVQPFIDRLFGIVAARRQVRIAYDFLNQMIEYDDVLGGRHLYAYDALGRRIQKVVDADGAAVLTRYVCDNKREIEEQDAAGDTIASYVFGMYVDEVLALRRCGVPNVRANQSFAVAPADWAYRGVGTHDAPVEKARMVRSGQQNTAGLAFLNAGLVTDDFQVDFDFGIANLGGNVVDQCGSLGPDGLTFFVTDSAPAAPGGIGRDLGYGGFPAQSFAVEFDSFCNPAYADPDSNHVGLDVGGLVVGGSLATSPVVPNFDSTGTWHVRIRYQAGQVTVHLTPPGGIATMALVSVVPAINRPATKYMGFSAGTGLNSADTHVDNVVIQLFGACGDVPPVDLYYATDDRHNTTALMSASGAAVERYEYGDFGMPSFFDVFALPVAAGGSGNELLFQGRRFDAETGLYYYRTRYLEPGAGRFTTRDRLGIWTDAANVGNGYTMVGNNPWTWLDPDGQITVKTVKKDKLDCGGFDVRWVFELDKAATCDGFMVQKVDYASTVQPCGGKPVKTEKTYFESWVVEKGKTKFKQFDTYKYSDNAYEPSHPSTCGNAGQTGKIKFFCKTTTGNLGDLSTDGDWKAGGEPMSGILPSTKTEPKWWSDASEDPEASRSAKSEWDCCVNPPTNTLTVAPDMVEEKKAAEKAAEGAKDAAKGAEPAPEKK